MRRNPSIASNPASKEATLSITASRCSTTSSASLKFSAPPDASITSSTSPNMLETSGRAGSSEPPQQQNDDGGCECVVYCTHRGKMLGKEEEAVITEIGVLVSIIKGL